MNNLVEFNYKRATKRLLSYIARCINAEKSLHYISEGLRTIVNSYDGLTRNERYDLYNNAYQVARESRYAKDWHQKMALNKSFDAVLGAARRVKGSSELRNKKKELYSAMQTGDYVFYLCSSHIKPAQDHADYQGKIYVDRFWRQKVDGRYYRAVSAYIRNHQIVSVQDIMGAPVYMTTRPYCKHYFIPMDTSKVLGSSRRKLVLENGYDRDVLWSSKEYYDLRDKVYTQLDNISPSWEFHKKLSCYRA